MKYHSHIRTTKNFIKYHLLKSFTKNEFKDELDILFKYFLLVQKPKYKIMFDVGAHLGEVSYNYLKEGFTVYAFEPDRNAPKVEALNDLKKYKNFHLSQLAASEVSGQELDFFTSTVSTGISSALKFHSSHTPAGKVKTVALRDFISEHGINGIDFIKIDTEGYDFFVIKGLGLDRMKPSFIICEFEDNKSGKIGYSVGDMIGYLEQYGYKIIISEWHPIEQYGVKHAWKQFLYPPQTPDKHSWGNLFAVLPECYENFSEFIMGLKIK